MLLFIYIMNAKLATLPVSYTHLDVYKRQVNVNKGHLAERETQIKLLGSVIKLLRRLKVKFSSHFVYIEQLDTDFCSLRECLCYVEQEVQNHRVVIAQKLEQEVKNINDLSQSLNESWSVRKPVSPTLTPPEALKILESFSDSVIKLKKKIDSISNAAKMLLIPIVLNDQLAHIAEDVKQYEIVWSSIKNLWEDVQRSFGMPWCRVHVLSLIHI